MDSEAVHFLGQAQFQLSGNILAKLPYTLGLQISLQPQSMTASCIQFLELV